MNSCKYCGKEISKYKKFCNSSCAAKYNNVHRTRKGWTEEQKQRFSLESRKRADFRRKLNKESGRYDENGKLNLDRHCKYCGRPSGNATVCEECNGYRKTSLYKKLKLEEGPLKERFKKAKEIIRDLYFNSKKSIPEIREITDLHTGSIRYLLTVDGGVTRDHTESNKVSLETGRRKETPCSFKFKQGIHTSWEGNKFHFRSSWEEQYMQELDEKKIPYLYEAFRIRYFDTQKGEERIAVPDFFLPETNTIVELKSSYTYDEQNMKDRFNSYREKGYKTTLLLDWEEINL